MYTNSKSPSSNSIQSQPEHQTGSPDSVRDNRGHDEHVESGGLEVLHAEMGRPAFLGERQIFIQIKFIKKQDKNVVFNNTKIQLTMWYSALHKKCI